MNSFAEAVLKELQRAIAAQQYYIARLQDLGQREPLDVPLDAERQTNLKEAAQALTALIEGYITMTCNPPEELSAKTPLDALLKEALKPVAQRIDALTERIDNSMERDRHDLHTTGEA